MRYVEVSLLVPDTAPMTDGICYERHFVELREPGACGHVETVCDECTEMWLQDHDVETELEPDAVPVPGCFHRSPELAAMNVADWLS